MPRDEFKNSNTSSVGKYFKCNYVLVWVFPLLLLRLAIQYVVLLMYSYTQQQEATHYTSVPLEAQVGAG